MIEKENEIQEVFENLNQDNQNVMLLLAKGMEIAQSEQQAKVK